MNIDRRGVMPVWRRKYFKVMFGLWLYSALMWAASVYFGGVVGEFLRAHCWFGVFLSFVYRMAGAYDESK